MWILIIFTAFAGIVSSLAYDPRFVGEIIMELSQLIMIMAFFYGLANNMSRHLNEIDTMLHSLDGIALLVLFS